jgi:hypothetical protein
MLLLSDNSETINRLVTQILDVMPVALSPDADVSTYDSPLVRKLDSLFWTQVERIVTSAIEQNVDHLVFNSDERLLLDMGIMDDRLLGSATASIRTQIGHELTSTSHGNVFYMTQWLSERLHQFIAVAPLTSGGSRDAVAGTPETASTATSMLKVRLQIYSAVRPLLANQPGMNDKLVDLLCSGKLDATIHELSARGVKDLSAPQAATLEKLKELRRVFLMRAYESCTTNEQRTALDSLVRVDARISRWLNANVASSAGMVTELASKVPTVRERAAFLLSELKFIKSVFHLGTAHTGLKRPQCTYLPGQKHLSKAMLASIVREIYEADVNLPQSPNILIAPYTGLGFFEWDRDTVFVPLNAVRSNEESIAAAFANLHILIDTLRSDRVMQKEYVAAVGPADFHTSFMQGYEKWLFGTCRGDAEALEGPEYKFFRLNIGPVSGNLFAPKSFVSGSATERLTIMRDCRQRISKNMAHPLDCYRLAVIYWSDGRAHAAKEQMDIAAKLSPADGRTMFVLGFLCADLREREGARIYFERCITVAPKSLWRVMAEECLAELP